MRKSYQSYYHHLLTTHSRKVILKGWSFVFANINHYNALDQRITPSYVLHSTGTYCRFDPQWYTRKQQTAVIVYVFVYVSYIFLIHQIRVCIVIDISLRYTTFSYIVYITHGVRWTLKSGGLGGGGIEKSQIYHYKNKKSHIFPKIWGGGGRPLSPPPATDPMT